MRLYVLNAEQQRMHSTIVNTSNSSSSTTNNSDYRETAEFIFALMSPNNNEQVDRYRFNQYAKSIYALNVICRDDFGISNRRRSINIDELNCAINEQFTVYILCNMNVAKTNSIDLSNSYNRFTFF